MAYTKEQKRAWRQRPEVRAYNKAWRDQNKKHIAEYMRDYRRKVSGGSPSSTTTRPDLPDAVDGSKHACLWLLWVPLTL